ncbi:MAG: hypothetical protein F4227_03890 [Gammaproteobacteria bacterium]|nr:hypothetical protein [Gammaproteobacteria bacterium]MYF02124.1 hypothetical protein [Gammaproteobacteria bacterium]MYI77764.1 hypothetical protein [Gammaproteobacteria bacterium]
MKLKKNSEVSHVQLHRSLIVVLLIFSISSSTSCSSPNKPDPNITLFVRTVESCVCNYLDIEDDNPSGLTYEDFIEDCNRTVRESHPNRFTDIEDSEPEMDSLRCPEKVESWLKVIAEQERLRENNRELMQEIIQESSDTKENSDSIEE